MAGNGHDPARGGDPAGSAGEVARSPVASMGDERRGWLTASALAAVATRRPLAASLPVAGAPAATSWLPKPVAEVVADAAPEPCPGCGKLAALEAGLTAEQTAAAQRGRDEGLAETKALRDRLTAAVTALSSVRTDREAALTETIVDVALGLCEWLAPAAAAIDRRALAPLVTQALAAGGNRDLVLRLNGDDAAELGSHIPAGVTCEVVADLAPGEIWVEGPRLVIDARWPTRLAALREPLLALLKNPVPPAHESASERSGSTLTSARIAAPPAPEGRAKSHTRSGS